MSTPLMEIDLAVGPPVEIGVVAGQSRRCIPILGGTVSGSLSGEVLAGGADWQQIGPDGTIEIDAHYVLKLAQGLVEVESRGLRSGPPDVLARLAKGEAVDPALYYFRTAMRFRCAAPELAWLGRILAVATGERLAGAVRLTVHEVA
ncbi:DUF3237 domain-containing protein [Sandarakinorhabdus sp. AAP62]|uniref:DUF3237 domain-containing protein n=1 Tax=Sandarakinorhabdus sp. AAP62 TaxID=1248916 RepID=UPI0003108EBA|nr:DUF3237 domain-containing protein [Sandarakinorhabdus sp. AAP62]